MDKHYFEAVYDLVRMVPEGRISTYGAIADFLTLGSARMVGWALRHCGSEIIPVPAHRIVNRKGELTGRNHFDPPEQMAVALIAEGVPVVDNKVVEPEKYLWVPGEDFG
jgi:methylated-DNA-protein-cysteine methyltransferase related protein